MKSRFTFILTAVIALLAFAEPANAYFENWTGESLANGKFYLYNRHQKRYLKAISTSTTNPLEATLFTIQKRNRGNYYSISCAVNGSTYYVRQNDGAQQWNTSKFDEWKIEANNGGYYINEWVVEGLAIVGRYRYISVETNGTISYPFKDWVDDDRTWILISEAQYNAIYPQNWLRSNSSLNNAGIVASEWSTPTNETVFNRTVLSNNVWCAESYTDSRNTGRFLEITLSNLAPGYYNLIMNGYAGSVNRNATEGGSGYAKMVVNGQEQNMPAHREASGSNGAAETYTFNNVLVGSNGQLVIYVEVTNAEVNWVLASIRNLMRSDYSVVEKHDGVIFAAGEVAFSAITNLLSDDVYAVDMEYATLRGTSLPVAVSNSNPNLLVYAAAGQVSNSKNVVTNGSCSNYVLEDSNYPVGVPTSFVAASAKYTMNAIAGGVMGTLLLPFTANLPADGRAFVLDEEINSVGNTIWGTLVTQVLPNQPVLVTKAGLYTNNNVRVEVSMPSETYSEGNLTGVYKSDAAPQGVYVLQNHTDDRTNTGVTGVGFYLVTASSGTQMKPFRAYIPRQDASNVKAFKVLFEDETTGVEPIENAEEAASRVAYDLSGRRVSNPSKGIYIVNGKKVVLK